MEIEYFEVKSDKNTLRGLLHKGENAIPVIIVHGFFSSNKIGPYRLYYSIAEQLNIIGYTVLRIDFSAMGESDGASNDITFQNHVNDLEKAIEELLEYTNSQSVHIIAHCVGCCTSLEYTYKNIQKIESMTLISPFIPNKNNFKRLLGNECSNNISNDNLILRKCMYFSRSFIDAGWVLIDREILGKINREIVEVFLPEKDELSPLLDATSWANDNNWKYDVVKDGDHNFLSIEGRKEILEKISLRFKILHMRSEGSGKNSIYIC